MTKKLYIFILLILSVTSSSIACHCSINETITSEYQKADFVATLKIVKNYKNFPDTNQYYKADVEIVNLYKGKHLKSIFILGNNVSLSKNLNLLTENCIFKKFLR